MLQRASLAFVLCFPLSGCSYSYDLKAVAIGGKLAFIVDPNSSGSAECFNQIDVIANDRVKVTPTAGDDVDRVRYGTVWHERLDNQCVDNFPVFYGQRLKGKRAPLSGHIEVVAAKPLRIGVVYEVTTTSGATGYGVGAFIIQPDRTILNVTPPKLTDDSDVLQPASDNGG